MKQLTTHDYPPRPIFIAGCERSGTTMLGWLLSEAAYTIATPESLFLAGSYRATVQEGLYCPRAIYSSIADHWCFRLWDITLADELLNGIEATPDAFARVIRTLVTTYAAANGWERPRQWVDHTPGNVFYYQLLSTEFPDAKFVHIVRDGRAVYHSVRKLSWGPRDPIQAGLHWGKALASGLLLEEELGSERVIRVHYEDVVSDPRLALERLCNFLNLELEISRSPSGSMRIPDYTKRQHALVGKAPDASRIDAWRRAFSPRSIELFESQAGSLLQALGYEAAYMPWPRPATRLERAWLGVIHLFNSLPSAREALRQASLRLRVKRARR